MPHSPPNPLWSRAHLPAITASFPKVSDRLTTIGIVEVMGKMGREDEARGVSCWRRVIEAQVWGGVRRRENLEGGWHIKVFFWGNLVAEEKKWGKKESGGK